MREVLKTVEVSEEEIKAFYDENQAQFKKSETVSAKHILVETEEDNSYLTDLGLNQYYPIITASDSPLLQEEMMNYDLVFYVYSQGILDFEGMLNLVMINIEDND